MKRVLALSVAPVLLAGSVLFSLPRPTAAASITMSDTFQYLRNTGPNATGQSVGLDVQLGADSVTPNGVQGTTGIATQGGTTKSLEFKPIPYLPNVVPIPIAGLPNRFHKSPAFDAALTGQWTLTFTNGPDTTIALTPDIANAPVVPLVQNLAMSGGGPTPSFGWTMPAGFTPDAEAVVVHDLALPDPDNQPIYGAWFTAVFPTSFTVPATFPDGTGLQPGHDYAFGVWLIDTRGHVVLPTWSEPDFLSISRTSIGFSVPEPVTALLLCTGLVALASVRKRLKKSLRRHR